MKKPFLLILSFFSCFLLQAQVPERIFYSTFSPEGWDIYWLHNPENHLKK